MFKFEGTRKPNFSEIKKIDYNRYWSERGFEINKKMKERELIILNNIAIDKKVLDIGCGNSRLPVELKEKGIDIKVADISEEVLRGFQKYNISSLQIDLEKIDSLKLDGKFDVIILSEVLEHTKNPEEIIGELKKYTKNFIITVPNSAFYRYRIGLFFGGRFFTQWVYHPSEHIRFWSHIDFLDWLNAMGLDIERSVSSNGFSLFGLAPFLKNTWKNLFGHQIVYFCKVK
jgi:methionine biosynthesis protein MetW